MKPGKVVQKLLILSIALVAFASVAGSQDASCKVEKVAGSGFLEKCGVEFRSVVLRFADRLDDEQPDYHGYLRFKCPETSCAAIVPEWFGYLMDSHYAAVWEGSKKDEQSLLAFAFAVPPPFAVSFSTSGPPNFPPSCAPFDVNIAGMTGRGACVELQLPNELRQVVMIVAADAQTGLVLQFMEAGKTAGQIRDGALKLLPQFTMERATGDAARQKWGQ